ncbi:hypothetical protein [Chryseobacterium cheonjiense]|uniref:Lipoprotein n=1 Tax=Chryseobacterium cheonjiense TaxID=2728845 RepID=A0A7Y0A530_9FLAO|nr:hypothetical protein [Chryseobacterium cheonjiense]NML56716.1 hypothetical protein [Chryseobacterium cheonjiense]
MKYQYIILIFLLFIGCNVQKNDTSQNSKIIKAKLYKIDFKDSIIIYRIRNEKMDGVFAKGRYCENKAKKQKLLQENKTYTFILEQESVDNHVSIVRDVDYYMAGYLIRKAGTPTIYYWNCLNVCGEYIIKEN